MAKDSEQKVSFIVDRIKRNPVALIITFVATLIVSLATLTDAVGQLSQLVGGLGGMSREEARDELRQLGLQYTAENFTEAARNGDLRVARLFLTAGMEADASGGRVTALMHAAANNDVPMIELLLDAGANVNQADTLGIAAAAVEPKTLRLLLQRADSEGMDRAYVYAAPAARPENLAMLWEHVADRKKTASQSLLNITEHISDSCSDDSVERVRHQIELGADTNITDEEGYFPLLYAARGKCLKAVQLLVDAKADVNARCACSGWLAGGWTALLAASDLEESRAIVELLLNRGADMNARTNDGSNALMLAVERDNADVVALLISKNIDINAGDPGGVTALMKASARGLQDIMQQLIDAGAEVNARSEHGYTALMRAAREGSVKSIPYLIEHKASIDLQNDGGQTALTISASRPGIDAVAVRYLLDQGAAIEHKDSEGHTALMLAAQRGNVAVVELLLARGAQPATKDLAGRTTADLVAVSLAAEDRGDERQKILFLLKQKSAGGKSRP